MQIINSEIRGFIEKQNPTDASLTDFVNHLTPNLTPTAHLHQIDPKVTTEPVLVYAHLMVQDMRDSYYYYSFVMKRPFKTDEQFMLYRWGNIPQNVPEQALESQEYLKVMIDRDQVICSSAPGLTEWASQIQGKQGLIDLMVDNKTDFKLGQIINIVAFYYPDHNKLYFVRRATPEEIEKQKMNPLSLMSKATVDYGKARQEILHIMSSYCSENFAEYLLLCLLSHEPLFLGAQADISPLIELLYPRVKHLKLVHPCEESLFPFKNEQGQMMPAPLQLSNESTFVSIDFSAFSEKDIVQIGEKTIDNFKALKVFVEENKTIYRWEIGESLIDHTHRGIVVKAASIVTPHFHPKGQEITPDFSTLEKIPKQTLVLIREYIAAAQVIESGLQQEERDKIEEVLKNQTDKAALGQQLGKIMQLAKLLARSYGRKDISMADFERAKFLVNEQVPTKKVQ